MRIPPTGAFMPIPMPARSAARLWRCARSIRSSHTSA
jgi:hypothetical protein